VTGDRWQVIVAICICFAFAAQPEVFVSYKEAIKKSEKDGKPVLVEFYATWCIPCIEMEKTVFKDPDVIKELKKNFHFIRLDTEKDEQIFCEGETLSISDCMMLWELEGIPAFAVLDKEGKLKHISVGDYKKQEFLNFLKAVKK
jgi:thiol:disulfide interchange protein